MQNAALMAAWLSGRLQSFTQPAALPLILLLMALATVFLFGNDRGHFYRSGHHDWLTSQHLAQAVNLSPEHNFLLFVNRTLDADGEPSYKTYARWPVGSYALVKLATLPFGDKFAARIYAARIVMLLLFAGSAVLAYLALARLTGDGWVALTATLLAFSSYHCLYYNDAFAPDAVPGLFGGLLAFHGMVIFEGEGRYRQLLVKACLALLLWWQVYALLLPYIVFGLARELFQARAGNSAPRLSLAGQIKSCGAALLSSRYLRLGIVTLAFGSAVLAFNVANEYFAFDRQLPLTQLPTVNSATYHYSGEPIEKYAAASEWGAFLVQQFYRIGQMTLPYWMNPFDSVIVHVDEDYLGLIAGALALAVGCIGLIFVRHKALLAAPLLAGFLWLLPLRNWSALHDFQALFYIGIPLAAFSLIMLYLRKRSGQYLATAFAVAALASFVVSAADMASVGQRYAEAEAEQEMMQDFAVIRSLVDDDGVVYVPSGRINPELGGAALASSYFLAGNVIVFDYSGYATRLARQIPEHRARADYIIIPLGLPGPALLTPDNRRVFLYDQAIYDGQYDEATLGSPLITSDWNVYLKDGSLIYTGEECANTDTPFFLHIVPLDVNDLPQPRQQHGFDNLDFVFGDFVVRSGAPCVAARALPGYDIAAIRTGQYTEDGRLWQGEYHFER